jgi:hypothetical protein
MLLPIIFPIAMSLDPFIDAVKLTANSGLEVPNATTVKPITIGFIPRSRDSFDEPLTSHSAPKYTPVIPAINKID